MPSSVIPLESIQIASPCRADWNAMQKVNGNDCVRFCPGCGKNVYDLSGVTREQAMNLIAAKEGNLCMRLHRRADGTVITSDCPVGKSARIKRNMFSQMLVAFVGFGSATIAVGGGLFHRFADKASSIPKQAKAQLVAAPTSTPFPTATAIPTPLPTRIPRLGPAPETIIISNAPPEAPPVTTSLPSDASVTVTMGAPCPPPEPTPTTPTAADAVITIPAPATSP